MQLFMEVVEFLKEHVFIVLWCCLLEARLRPQPCSARRCINTEEETRQLKSDKAKSCMEKLKKGCSWAPAAQSRALYIVDQAV